MTPETAPSRLPGQTLPREPEILTTTVGSYSPIPWVQAWPGEQTILDATAVVIGTQRRAGIDLPTDGELYRFDPDHPDTNGMIDYFVRRLGGIETAVGRTDAAAFRARSEMAFRRKPAGVVRGPLHEGTLDLQAACARSASVAGGPFKFTLTSPFMLARTLLDHHYGDFERLTLALADVLAEQVAGLPCACVQVDEANVPGSPDMAPLAAEAINRVLRRVEVERAVHLCFGNYGGQTIQRGRWKALTDFLNSLACDHLVLELAHRPADDLAALADIDARITLGVGVIDVKVNHVETPDEVAARIEQAVQAAGPERIRWVHPDCGFWMLHRSVVDRKIEALVAGRDLFLGR
ncbi:cobalamin-independent methionine synthase II family protein [Rhodocaloribacter litoris]|uniref:cobalamin-independent methionine synthase II family protein n=1 Tax=Rhodocaloribacter litoris TaxID=2558931 RepID=UPI00141ECBC1|nr:cobalamin-independent methionine synthase II family protein [Rhodocaloribacter litoris]QXD15137.1 cobalamin-independent methionine synthase II family protein [Rhodocaloribacter litoris]